jgi:predicted nuclease of predicted toxin-antitoxin system
LQTDLGVEAIHVGDIGLQRASDVDLWSYSSSNGFTLVSKDEDFVRLYSETPIAGLHWMRIGNYRRDFLLDIFRRVWPRILERFASGDRFIEVR